MAKAAVCAKCGKEWKVSAMLDTSRSYICPICDVKMGGPRYKNIILLKNPDR